MSDLHGEVFRALGFEPITSDIMIVHRTSDGLLLCCVDHHDKACAWAERRKLETHPTTGAAQLMEIRERVQEIVVPANVPAGRGRCASTPSAIGCTSRVPVRAITCW